MLPGGSHGLHFPHIRCGRQCLASQQNRVETTAFSLKHLIAFWRQSSRSSLTTCSEFIKRYNCLLYGIQVVCSTLAIWMAKCLHAQYMFTTYFGIYVKKFFGSFCPQSQGIDLRAALKIYRQMLPR